MGTDTSGRGHGCQGGPAETHEVRRSTPQARRGHSQLFPTLSKTLPILRNGRKKISLTWSARKIFLNISLGMLCTLQTSLNGYQ